MRFALFATLLLALACGSPGEAPTEPAAAGTETGEAELGLLRPSDRGLYRVSLRPADGEVPLQRLHSWIFHVETPEGEGLVPTRLAVDGGMPQHGHGFVTQPRITRPLGDGDFLVEGVKFHMMGEWTIRFEIAGAGTGDMATFRVQVQP